MDPAVDATSIEDMNAHLAQTVAIVVIVVGWILYQQLRERAVKDAPLRLPLILAVIGVIETLQYLSHHSHVAVGEIVGVLVGFVVAALLAAPRAHSMSVYRNASGTLVRRGGALTVVLWVVAIAAHVGIGMVTSYAVTGNLSHALSGLDGASTLVYLAITLGVQAAIIEKKAAPHRAAVRTSHHV